MWLLETGQLLYLLIGVFLEGLIVSEDIIFNALSVVRKILRNCSTQLSHRRLSLVYSTF